MKILLILAVGFIVSIPVSLISGKLLAKNQKYYPSVKGGSE